MGQRSDRKTVNRGRVPARLLCFVIPLILFTVSCETGKKSGTYDSVQGAFRCKEDHPLSGIRTYLVEIEQVKDKADVYIISNFYNAGFNEFLFVNLDGQDLIIDDQIITGLLVSGEGTVSDDYKTITWEYEVDDGITVQNMLARYTRD